MKCPCSSDKNYEECCKPFHVGALPENALELMRSRFAAYALNLPQYIIDTTHPANRHYSDNKFLWRRHISKFCESAEFEKLEVLGFKEKDNMATVSFVAYIKQDGEDATFTEKSYFDKVHGKWLYRTGQLIEGHAPNMIIADELKILPLAYYGNEVLRKVAEPVGEITDEIRDLVEAMVETMDVNMGIGLAAPQVHYSLRLFVVRVPGEEEMGPLRVFINPEIMEETGEVWSYNEGCLSIPGIYGDVERMMEVKVEYTDLEGNRKQESFSGLEARAILHENDHINGVLFFDRMEKRGRKKLEPALNNLKKRIHDAIL